MALFDVLILWVLLFVWLPLFPQYPRNMIMRTMRVEGTHVSSLARTTCVPSFHLTGHGAFIVLLSLPDLLSAGFALSGVCSFTRAFCSNTLVTSSLQCMGFVLVWLVLSVFPPHPITICQSNAESFDRNGHTLLARKKRATERGAYAKGKHGVRMRVCGGVCACVRIRTCVVVVMAMAVAAVAVSTTRVAAAVLVVVA